LGTEERSEFGSRPRLSSVFLRSGCRIRIIAIELATEENACGRLPCGW
jgi:hypothetical protein